MIKAANFTALVLALALGACQTAKRPDPQIVLAGAEERQAMAVLERGWVNTIAQLQREGGEAARRFQIVRREPGLMVVRRNSDHGFFGSGGGHLLIEFATEQTGPDVALRSKIFAVQNPDSRGEGRLVPIDDSHGWFVDNIKNWIADVLTTTQGNLTRATRLNGVPIVVTLADDAPIGATVQPDPSGAFRVDLGATHGACEGVTTGTGTGANLRGTWTVACAKGLKATGIYTVDATGRISNGEGVTADGRKVTYKYGPMN